MAESFGEAGEDEEGLGGMRETVSRIEKVENEVITEIRDAELNLHLLLESTKNYYYAIQGIQRLR